MIYIFDIVKHRCFIHVTIFAIENFSKMIKQGDDYIDAFLLALQTNTLDHAFHIHVARPVENGEDAQYSTPDLLRLNVKIEKLRQILEKHKNENRSYILPQVCHVYCIFLVVTNTLTRF